MPAAQTMAPAVATSAPAPVPTAQHRGADELPWMPGGEGVQLKLYQASVSQGVWVLANRFSAGVTLQTHRHTGAVYAFTHSGAWKYVEGPETNRAGSYLYEPAGSVHTLTVLDDETEVQFVIHGANLNLAADGETITHVTDAGTVLAHYRAYCASVGLPDPPVLTD